MRVDYKTTIWHSLEIADDIIEEQLIEILKNGFHPLNSLEDSEINYFSSIIYETEEYITPQENGNQPTIELWDGNDLKWTNE